MSGRQGRPEPTLEEIRAARNQALERQAQALAPADKGLRDDPSRVATALDQAHRDAAAIKAAEDIETADDKADHHTSLATKVWMVSSVAPSDDNPPPTAPAGGGPAGGGPAARADPAPSEGMQASAESALGRACAAAAEAGEALAQGVASADQSATTAARDAVATAAGAASAAGGAAADVAAKPADMAKSVVDAVRAGFKSLGLGGGKSDDDAATAKGQQPGVADVEEPSGHAKVSSSELEAAAPHTAPEGEEGPPADLASRVAQVEAARREVEETQARKAFEHAASKLVQTAGPPAGADDELGSHVHAATATGSPLIHSPLERPKEVAAGRAFPVIFTPVEPPNINSQLRMTTAPPDVASKAGQIDMGHEAPSQGEASTASCGVGDPAAQAGGVATLERGGHAAASAIKDAVGMGGPPTAPAPAGSDDAGAGAPAAEQAPAPPAPAPAEAVEQRQDRQEEGTAASLAVTAADMLHIGGGGGGGDGSGRGSGASDVALGVDAPVPGAGGDASSGGGGVLGMLGGLVSDIASKVAISTNSEELLSSPLTLDAAAAAPPPSAADATAGAGSGGGASSQEQRPAEKDAAAAGSDADAAQRDQAQRDLGGGDEVTNPLLHSTVKEGDAFVKRPEARGPGREPEGVGGALRRGWEELKVGGAKAPWVDTQGETSAPQDVTSNVERSRHIGDDQEQKRIYDGETYKTAPVTSSAAADQAATDEAKAARGVDPDHPSEAVAGDKSQKTGATPHPKAEGPSQPGADRFSAGKGGIFSSIGTGSAAPYTGDDSVKRAFTTFSAARASAAASGNGRGAALAAVADGGAGVAGGSAAGSSSAAAPSLLPAAFLPARLRPLLRGVGVASAKDPSGKEMKDEQQLLVREEPASGRMHVVGNTAAQEGRPPEQNNPRPPADAALMASKVERLGQAVGDLARGPPPAGKEGGSLWGKDSGDREDGVHEFLGRTAHDIGESVSRAPEAAASAAHKAVEIASGVAEHVAGRTREVGSNLAASRDPRSAEQVDAKMQAGVDRAARVAAAAGIPTDPPPSDSAGGGPGSGGGGGAGGSGGLVAGGDAAYKLQMERLAQGGRHPAHERETLTDKILEPLVRDASDDTRARELAKSYQEYKEGHAPAPGQTEAESGAGGSAASGAGGEPAATVRPALCAYDPIGHMQGSKEADASKLTSGPGTDQDPSHLARDQSGRRVGQPAEPHPHATREADPLKLQEQTRQLEAEDEQRGKEERRRFFGLPQTPEGAAQSVSSGLGPKAKAKAAARAQEQSEGRFVTLGQAMEGGIHAVQALFGVQHEEHPAEAQAKDALAARAKGAAGAGGSSDEGRGAAGASADARGEGRDAADKLRAAGGKAGKAASEAAHAAGGGGKEEERGAGGAGRGKGGVSGALEGVAERVGHAIGYAIAAAERVGGGVARDDVARARRDAEGAAERARRGAEAAGDEAKQLGRDARGRAEGVAESVQRAASRAGDAVRENVDELAETGRQWGGEVEHNSAAEGVRGAAERAGAALEGAASEVPAPKGAASGTAADFAADAVGEEAGRAGAEGERAGDAARAAADRAAEEASRAASAAGAAGGGLLASLAQGAAAVLGTVLGPLEREGAFDKSAAVISGTPVSGRSEPVGAERLTADEVRDVQERARAPAIDERASRAADEAADARRAALGGDAGRGDAGRGGGGGVKEPARRGAEAPAGESFDIGEKMQAALGDAAAAAGATAGHAQDVASKAAAALAHPTQEADARAAKERGAALNEGPATIAIPPAFGGGEVEFGGGGGGGGSGFEGLRSTEEILAERAREAAARAQEEGARGPARV